MRLPQEETPGRQRCTSTTTKRLSHPIVLLVAALVFVSASPEYSTAVHSFSSETTTTISTPSQSRLSPPLIKKNGAQNTRLFQSNPFFQPITKNNKNKNVPSQRPQSQSPAREFATLALILTLSTTTMLGGMPTSSMAATVRSDSSTLVVAADESVDDSFSSMDSGFSTQAVVVPSTTPTPLNPADTVRATVDVLKRAQGNVDSTLQAYETVADIITEGTGVGGKINYKGIQLERGYVADEDTTLYNPGLSLLTEGEKQALMQAVLDARKAGVAASQWNDNVELGYQFLKQALDPWHVVELRGYLQILPWYGGAVYLAVLAVQQLVLNEQEQNNKSPSARTPFTIAYLVGVAAVFGPALVLIAVGPQ